MAKLRFKRLPSGDLRNDEYGITIAGVWSWPSAAHPMSYALHLDTSTNTVPEFRVQKEARDFAEAIAALVDAKVEIKSESPDEEDSPNA